MMTLSRSWATPLAAGAFLVSAVTGVLIFLHIDSGLNKRAHEWLSWLLLGAVGLHIAANFGAFRRYFGTRTGQLLIGAGMLALALSFLSAPGGKREPPFMASVHALSNAPLSTLALVAQVSLDELRTRLAREGLQPDSDTQTLVQLAGGDAGHRTRLLTRLLAGEANTAPTPR